MNKILFLMSLTSFIYFGSPAWASYILHNGKPIESRYFAQQSLGEHFENGKSAIDSGNWEEAIEQFKIVIVSFSKTVWAQDAQFYLGKAYYHCGDYDLSESYFTAYLDQQGHAENFEEAWQYKFDVAEKYRQGAKRHLFNKEQLPCWLSGKEKALEIYDEVINIMPGHGLAAKALFSKGQLLFSQKDYQGALDAYTILVNRYPRSEEVPQSFFKIAEIYKIQSVEEGNNPDLMVLAEINLNHFKERFPRDERIVDVEKIISDMQEICAQGLYDTAKFYERIKKPHAAVVYYLNTVEAFPKTKVADRCAKSLDRLHDVVKKMNLSWDRKNYEKNS